MRRVALIVSHADAATDVLTFRRPDDDGMRPYWMAPGPPAPAGDPARFEEDVKFRGLHPMIARRLQMWRLANFEITPPAGGRRRPPLRLRRAGRTAPTSGSSPSPRSATSRPVRDEAGRAVAIPEVESHLVAALDAIRQAARRPPGR